MLHQMLQWHHWASHIHSPDTLSNLQFVTLVDGVFRTAAWILALWGIVMGEKRAERCLAKSAETVARWRVCHRLRRVQYDCEQH